MIEGIFFMLGLGIVCAAILTAASRIFYVYEDPRIAEVEACFAGANCGGCGYTGCSAAAVAVVAGTAEPSVCIVGGPESATSAAEVMGVEVGLAESPKHHEANAFSPGSQAPWAGTCPVCGSVRTPFHGTAVAGTAGGYSGRQPALSYSGNGTLLDRPRAVRPGFQGVRRLPSHPAPLWFPGAGPGARG